MTPLPKFSVSASTLKVAYHGSTHILKVWRERSPPCPKPPRIALYGKGVCNDRFYFLAIMTPRSANPFAETFIHSATSQALDAAIEFHHPRTTTPPPESSSARYPRYRDGDHPRTYTVPPQRAPAEHHLPHDHTNYNRAGCHPQRQQWETSVSRRM